MALKKSISKPISKIKYLKQKLDGKLPVTYEDLLILVTSHGVNKTFEINIFDNIVIEIEKCEPNQCYDLSKLDTSKITNMYSLFAYNNFNGDISNWDVSNVTNFSLIFANSKFNNDSLNNWDVYNCKDMIGIFSYSSFDSDISSWNFNKDSNLINLFNGNNNFKNKYNNGNMIPNYSNDFIIWFEENRDKIRELNQGTKDEVLDFFSFDLNKEIEKI